MSGGPATPTRGLPPRTRRAIAQAIDHPYCLCPLYPTQWKLSADGTYLSYYRQGYMFWEPV